MDFSVHLLGSGSSGNSILIQGGDTHILIDAGISVLQLQKRLSKFRVRLEDIDGIFLTHEHGDHARSVYALSRRFGIPVIANSATLTILSKEFAPLNWYVLDTGCSKFLGDLLIESFPLSHDAVDPVGYNVYYKNWKASFVIDTGTTNEEILRWTEGANLAVVESNHDIKKLLESPYPLSLKRRILSKTGHLSNEAAGDFLIRHLSRNKQTSCIWLVHLSRTNNSPRAARKHIQRRLSEAGFKNVLLGVALPDIPNLVWRPGKHLPWNKIHTG